MGESTPKFLVIDGPCRGTQIPVPGVGVMGRSKDSDIVLDDGSVASSHAKIELSPAGYVLRDLGSTAGTVVNGVRISGQCLLKEGDVVSVGQTRLRLEGIGKQDPAVQVTPGGTQKLTVSPASSRKKKPVLIVAVGCAVFVLAVFVAKSLFSSPGGAGPSAATVVTGLSVATPTRVAIVPALDSPTPMPTPVPEQLVEEGNRYYDRVGVELDAAWHAFRNYDRAAVILRDMARDEDQDLLFAEVVKKRNRLSAYLDEQWKTLGGQATVLMTLAEKGDQAALDEACQRLKDLARMFPDPEDSRNRKCIGWIANFCHSIEGGGL